MITRSGHLKVVLGALGLSCSLRRGRATNIRKQMTVYFGIGSMTILKRGAVQMATKSTSSSRRRYEEEVEVLLDGMAEWQHSIHSIHGNLGEIAGSSISKEDRLRSRFLTMLRQPHRLMFQQLSTLQRIQRLPRIPLRTIINLSRMTMPKL